MKGMEHFHRYFLPTMSPLFLVLSLVSCYAPPPRFETVEMAEQEDIPVPKRFELRHSYSPKMAVELNFRSWVGEYAGEEQIGVLVPWYISEMRSHHWQLRRLEEKVGDAKSLYFEKGDETSTVEVSRRLDGKHGGFLTFVQVRVSPRGPEDFTVDEHLKRKEAGFQQVSLRKGESEEPYQLEKAIEPGASDDVGPGVKAQSVGAGTEDGAQGEESAEGKSKARGPQNRAAVESKPRGSKKAPRPASPSPEPKSRTSERKGGADLKSIEEFEAASH